ncbi:MAG: riboflavin synthase, partial [Candidatus Peribacter sp.]|nr:riboflavin synthase [Candidatus Peribacter sp.]
MFTGIIEATAPVLSKTDSQLLVARPELFADITIGASIAVSGVCLSVISFDEDSMTFDVVEET